MALLKVFLDWSACGWLSHSRELLPASDSLMRIDAHIQRQKNPHWGATTHNQQLRINRHARRLQMALLVLADCVCDPPGAWPQWISHAASRGCSFEAECNQSARLCSSRSSSQPDIIFQRRISKPSRQVSGLAKWGVKCSQRTGSTGFYSEFHLYPLQNEW